MDFNCIIAAEYLTRNEETGSKWYDIIPSQIGLRCCLLKAMIGVILCNEFCGFYHDVCVSEKKIIIINGTISHRYIWIPTFGNRCLSAIGGGKQRPRLAGWVQLSAEAAPGPHGVSQSLPGRWEYRWRGKFTQIAALQQHFIFFYKSVFNSNCVLIISSYFFFWNFIVWRTSP